MIPSRRLLATAFWILAIFPVWGCALPQEGRLPKAELPTAPPVAEPKPSLSFQISFLPPGSDKEQKLIGEFVQEFESSHVFGMIAQAPAASDIRMKIVLTQACAATSKDFALYLATGGLSPIHVPCEYELQAEIHGCSGKYVKYEIRDKVSSLVLAPGWPPGVDWSIDPASSEVRRNMYRTLMVKMCKDGVIGECADLPRN